MATRKEFIEELKENLKSAMALSEYWLSFSDRKLKDFNVAVSFCGSTYVSMDGGQWWEDFTPEEGESWKIFHFDTQEEALNSIEELAWSIK